MESHRSYPALAPYVKTYPQTIGASFQTYNDILYAQGWKDVELVDMKRCKRVGMTGKRLENSVLVDTTLHVVPCSLAETLSISWIKAAFEDVSDPDPPSAIYLAITDTDSSIVYYKISSGIVKPPV